MDDFMDCFTALKIHPTNYAHIIKQAYHKALQEQLSDISTSNFTTLRRSYIKALRHARGIFKEPYPPTNMHLENIQHAYHTPLEKMTISSLRHALSLQPHNPFILTDLAKEYLGTSKYRLAIDILKAIDTFYPQYTKARQLLLTAEAAWCLRLAKRFNNLSPEDIEYLIRYKMCNNQHKEALTFLEKAILTRLKGLHPPTLFKLSAECMAALRIDAAPHYFEKSLEHTHELNENPRETLLAYIEYLFAFKQFDTLILLIDDLIELDPNQHRYHYLKGESLRQTKRYKQSITSLRYAIGLAPNKAAYYHCIAHAYRESGKNKKANTYAKAGANINTVDANEQNIFDNSDETRVNIVNY
jgi:tetratricopeptide (TPR) repeat protein